MRWAFWDTVVICLCVRTWILVCLSVILLAFMMKLGNMKATTLSESLLVLSSLSKVQEELQRQWGDKSLGKTFLCSGHPQADIA